MEPSEGVAGSRVEGVAGVLGEPVPLAGVGVAEGPVGSGRVRRGHAGPGSATGGGLGRNPISRLAEGVGGVESEVEGFGVVGVVGWSVASAGIPSASLSESSVIS